MVTLVKEKQVIDYKQAKIKYDGRWLLFDQRDFPLEEDIGYVIAYGDGIAGYSRLFR